MRRFVLGTIMQIASATIILLPTLAYNEPDNFAGLKFGHDIREQLEPCPSRVIAGKAFPDDYEIRRTGKRCQSEYDFSKKRDEPDIRYMLYNLGEIQKQATEIHARQANDKLAEIVIFFKTANAPTLLAIFRERYGQPTEESSKPWQSKGGVKTTSTTTLWRGQDVSITFIERDNRIDTGAIIYETEIWKEKQRARASDTIKKGAEGL